jgi:hypothetical protein
VDESWTLRSLRNQTITPRPPGFEGVVEKAAEPRTRRLNPKAARGLPLAAPMVKHWRTIPANLAAVREEDKVRYSPVSHWHVAEKWLSKVRGCTGLSHSRGPLC